MINCADYHLPDHDANIIQLLNASVFASVTLLSKYNVLGRGKRGIRRTVRMWN